MNPHIVVPNELLFRTSRPLALCISLGCLLLSGLEKKVFEEPIVFISWCACDSWLNRAAVPNVVLCVMAHATSMPPHKLTAYTVVHAST